MNSNIFSVQLTYSAANKVKFFIEEQHTKKKSNLKLRVYIVGGGCVGFQYGFILDDKIFDNDYIIESYGASIVIDPMSLQYLTGGIIDYKEELEGSKFVVINPNVKLTCSCGSSFNI